ncbi:MAG TPA: hypothetical protein VF600_12890 [Abditibacteriaceae bacterium]
MILDGQVLSDAENVCLLKSYLAAGIIDKVRAYAAGLQMQGNALAQHATPLRRAPSS